uniref:Cytochrome n=2 Tax=Lutzomyia longipalpis TaxID=7200 RepID=A0A1B0GIK5_LUTLO
MLLFLYILFVIGSGIYFFLTWNYKHWEKRGIPSPEPKILCGNLQGAVFGKKHVVYDFDRIYKNYKNQYSFVGVYSLRQPQYLITDARTAKDILITKFKSFHDNEVADMSDKKKDPILVSHPFMVKGEEWKEKRNEMTPAFTRLRIKAMYSIFQETAEHLKMALLRANGGTIDGYETCAHYAIDVVSNCIFGRDAGALSNGKSKILDMGRQFVFSTRFLLYFMAVQFLPSLKKIYKFSAVGKDVEEFFLNEMKDAIALRLKNQNKRKDHLNYLLDLRAKKNLS